MIFILHFYGNALLCKVVSGPTCSDDEITESREDLKITVKLFLYSLNSQDINTAIEHGKSWRSMRTFYVGDRSWEPCMNFWCWCMNCRLEECFVGPFGHISGILCWAIRYRYVIFGNSSESLVGLGGRCDVKPGQNDWFVWCGYTTVHASLWVGECKAEHRANQPCILLRGSSWAGLVLKGT